MVLFFLYVISKLLLALVQSSPRITIQRINMIVNRWIKVHNFLFTSIQEKANSLCGNLYFMEDFCFENGILSVREISPANAS